MDTMPGSEPDPTQLTARSMSRLRLLRVIEAYNHPFRLSIYEGQRRISPVSYDVWFSAFSTKEDLVDITAAESEPEKVRNSLAAFRFGTLGLSRFLEAGEKCDPVMVETLCGVMYSLLPSPEEPRPWTSSISSFASLLRDLGVRFKILYPTLQFTQMEAGQDEHWEILGESLSDLFVECLRRLCQGQRVTDYLWGSYSLETRLQMLDMRIQQIISPENHPSLPLKEIDSQNGLPDDVLERFPSMAAAKRRPRLNMFEAMIKNIEPSSTADTFHTTGETLVSVAASSFPGTLTVQQSGGSSTLDQVMEINSHSAFPPKLCQSIRRGEHHDLLKREDLPYTSVRILGHGGFGIVEEVIDITTNAVFARKSIRNERDEDLSVVRKSFLNEVEIIKRLSNHRHVIKVFASYTLKRELAVILEPVADGGDLHSMLLDIQESDSPHSILSLHESTLYKAFGCLLSGLAFMHKYNIRHKDIKPKNVLIHQGSVLFTDFGASLDSSLLSGSTTAGQPGPITRRYCAPEVADWESRNAASDVFSLGCVFVEIIRVLKPKLSHSLRVPAEYHRETERIQKTLRSLSSCEDVKGHILSKTSYMLEREPGLRWSAKFALEAYAVKFSNESGLICTDCLFDALNHAEEVFDLNKPDLVQSPDMLGVQPQPPLQPSTSDRHTTVLDNVDNDEHPATTDTIAPADAYYEDSGHLNEDARSQPHGDPHSQNTSEPQIPNEEHLRALLRHFQ